MTTKREFEAQCDYDWGKAAEAIRTLETQLAEARADATLLEIIQMAFDQAIYMCVGDNNSITPKSILEDYKKEKDI